MRAAVGLFLLAVTSGCWAWNKPTHEITAIIAYKLLAVSRPDVIESVAQIMLTHPGRELFDERMSSASARHEEPRERLFMEMAQWADEVRQPGVFHKYDRPTWHYVNIPFGPRPAELERGIPGEGPHENIFFAFRENVRLVSDSRTDPSAKAVALCWIFHLAGDLHQPLHTTSLVDSRFPDGDRGGNLFQVRLRRDGAAVNLHAFWDGLVIGSARPQAVRNKALALMAEHPATSLYQLRSRPYTNPDSFETWGRQESHELAISAAYGELISTVYMNRDAVLSERYVSNARDIGEAQVVIAGYRLAEVLTQLVSVIRQ